MTPSLMPTVSPAPADNPVQDCPNPVKLEPTSPIMAEQRTQPTSIPILQTDEVLLDPGDTLPDHLMQLLRDWHRQNPKRKPPCSYHPAPSRRGTITFSRTFKSLSLYQISVAAPVQYAMVILSGEQEPAKFVRCVTGASSRTFFKAWLGGDKFEDRASAVRISDPSSDDPRELVTEELWKAADLKSPLPLSAAKPGPGPVTTPHYRRRSRSEAVLEDNSSAGSSTSESESEEEYETLRTPAQKRRRITGPEQQPSEEHLSSQDSSKWQVSEQNTPAQDPSQRKLAEQNGNQSGKIDFKLVAPSSFSGSRSFTVEEHNDGKSLFKRCRDFFRVFGEMAPILICRISAHKVGEDRGPEMIFDAQDMAHLLEKLREQTAGGKRLTVTVEIKED